ncbi:prolyl oligopeptidase family serine peptidase, partial [Rhodococcus opacus]|nr:prolyl oligopeptidase family serine peptidase [Rhodococcus opacus]
YTDLQVAPDGSTVFALRASYATPPHPVRIDLTTGAVSLLKAPAELPELPGTLTEVETVAADAPWCAHGWRLPTGPPPRAGPVGAVVHGGPLGSWTPGRGGGTRGCWWRGDTPCCCRIRRCRPGTGRSSSNGLGKWGKARSRISWRSPTPRVALPEIDEEAHRGDGRIVRADYMANWIAGHTDRFTAIVRTPVCGRWTSSAHDRRRWYWQREMTPEMAVENSPHLYVADIATPMLVIHGDKDFRVPSARRCDCGSSCCPSRDCPPTTKGARNIDSCTSRTRNHWILSPQNAKVWYQVVLSFLSEHVRGEDVALPEILGQ